MHTKSLILATCIISTLMLTGCKESKTSDAGTNSNLTNSGVIEGKIFAGGFTPTPSSPQGDLDITPGDTGIGADAGMHNPEPATAALVGTGLFAYGFLRKKKKK